MQPDAPDAIDRFQTLQHVVLEDDYNFQHFRTKHLINDIKRSLRRDGVAPGERAPDFDLPRAGGGTMRLSSLRGTPVLLHIGSYT